MNPIHKLKPEDLPAIKQMYTDNHTLTEIARCFDVTPPTVSSFLTINNIHVLTKQERKQQMRDSKRKEILDYLVQHGFQGFAHLRKHINLSESVTRRYLREIHVKREYDFGKFFDGSFKRSVMFRCQIQTYLNKGMTAYQIKEAMPIKQRTVNMYIREILSDEEIAAKRLNKP